MVIGIHGHWHVGVCLPRYRTRKVPDSPAGGPPADALSRYQVVVPGFLREGSELFDARPPAGNHPRVGRWVRYMRIAVLLPAVGTVITRGGQYRHADRGGRVKGFRHFVEGLLRPLERQRPWLLQV